MIVFDGRKFAEKLETELKSRVAELDLKPKLAIVLCGDDPASVKYVEMKSAAAKRVGVEVQIFKKLIEVDQDKFEGVMVQLPSDENLNLISPEKDVDGLNTSSDFVPATVKAIEKILDVALRELDIDIDDKLKIAIVGAKGNVGRPLLERMQRYGMAVTGFDLGDDLNKLQDFKIVISCTGQKDLIKGEMVKEEFVGIDVGFPESDFADGAAAKASFITPVPGGVGPMTVVSLLENVVNASEGN